MIFGIKDEADAGLMDKGISTCFSNSSRDIYQSV